MACTVMSPTPRFTVVEPMRLELGMSDSQIGLLQGLAFAVTYAVIGIPIAILLDQLNETEVLDLLAYTLSKDKANAPFYKSRKRK